MKTEDIVKKFEGKQIIDNSLGCELKRRRLIKNQTLAQVSDNVCSVSYISKVENNVIFPKMDVLRQMCLKLGMSTDQTKNLVNIEDILLKSIEAYYYEDHKRLEEIYENINNLDNYKSDLIKVIYFLTKKKYALIEKINDTIDQMLDSLNELDVLAYAVFKRVLCNKTQDYYESNKIFKTVLPYIRSNKYLEGIMYNYICKNHYHLNSGLFLNYYKKTIFINESFNNKKRLVRLKEINFLNYYKNNDLKNLEVALLTLKGEDNYHNFKALYEYQKDNTDYFSNDVIEKLDYFTACLVTYKFDKALFNDLIKQMDNKNLCITKQIYLHYLSIQDKEKKFDYLKNTCFLHSLRLKDKFLSDIYGEDLIDYYVGNAKYKSALKTSEDLRKLSKELKTDDWS